MARPFEDFSRQDLLNAMDAISSRPHSPMERRPIDDMPRMVVCAAMKHDDGRIIASPRHFDTIARQAAKDGFWGDCEQGFVDQRGVFMSRTEAWKVACDARQIRRRVGGDGTDGGTLYSENLY